MMARIISAVIHLYELSEPLSCVPDFCPPSSGKVAKKQTVKIGNIEIPPTSQIRAARHHEHAQGLAAPAYVDRAGFEAREIAPRAPGHVFGHDELTGEVLRHRFQTTRGIDRVADGGERRRVFVTHFADDDLTAVNADADAQRLR